VLDAFPVTVVENGRSDRLRRATEDALNIELPQRTDVRRGSAELPVEVVDWLRA
jgi:hypothetical protein